ncbi:oxygen-independent coproporphyrinogen-3 oxidase [Eubacterium uniforme]|uniref:Heme chaperone HemW n=1 Tax=Eubacterium uniforme TaxID=39495 RepID=A0A1T4VN83_9FIRM|nr:radical SAM family heme chaperone HemW [Eubacterium uniforme]SKA66423.1 oxygen-independent coproporphyrinogen-3 oxidase [Eubacterium uniforme]
MEIYVHIPFCIKKCTYCDFLSAPMDDEIKDKYVKALCKEIENGNNKDEFVSSIFIGGGTPTVLKGEYIEKIIYTICENYNVNLDAEISIECNPGTITYEKLISYKRSGINRISFGLQSSHNDELKKLGRIHTYEDFVENFELARQVGFKNINIDLMSGLINQSLKKFSDTLNKVAKLNPEHISVYSLIIEENTPLYEYVRKMERDGIDIRPLEEVEREMYKVTKQILSSFGYERYEISNYSKSGYECKHNIGYWTGIDYIGFGIGAASYKNFGNKAIRWKNTDSISKYLDNIETKQDVERLTIDDMMSEYMILGFRLCKGVSKKDFYNKFGVTLQKKYGDIINKYLVNGFLAENEDRVFLSEKGIDVSNYILCDFM